MSAQVRKDAYFILEPAAYPEKLRLRDLREFIKKLDAADVSDVAIVAPQGERLIAVYETEAIL